jgi:hypothetical protein
MTLDLFDNYKCCCIGLICIDDDARTRSMLKWSNEDWMKNNNTTDKPMAPITKGPNKGKLQPRPNNRGRLSGHIPEPSFVADPNHRKKVMTGELHERLKKPVAQRETLNKNDVTRLGKNFGYMVRNLQDIADDDDKMIAAGATVLDHHFDEHDNCGPWCHRRRLTQQQRDECNRFYRLKVNDDQRKAICYSVRHYVLLCVH